MRLLNLHCTPPKNPSKAAKQKRRRQKKAVTAANRRFTIEQADLLTKRAANSDYELKRSLDPAYPLGIASGRVAYTNGNWLNVAAITRDVGRLFVRAMPAKCRGITPTSDGEVVEYISEPVSGRPTVAEGKEIKLTPVVLEHYAGLDADGEPYGEHEPEGDSMRKAFSLLKNALFQADRPYRCRLGGYTNVVTNASGVLNLTQALTGVSSVSEWSTISLLFDSVFVHGMHLIYQPFNRGGFGVNTSATVGNRQEVTTTSAATNVLSQGLIAVALYANGATYGSAAAMISNPNRRNLHSGEKWSYTWRNNIRFDRHGPESTTSGWQGWIGVTNTASLGGQVQIRALADVPFGNGTAAVTLGTMEVRWDLSFRARV